MAVPSPTLKWKRHPLPPGFAVAILDGEPLAEVGGPAKGEITSGFHPVRVGIWFGTGHDLAEWRAGIGSNPGVTFGAERATAVCGAAARTIEAVSSTRPATAVTYVDGHHGAEPNPGETFVAVAFHYKDVPVVAFYVVPSAERARYAADEAHFFASIDCPR